MASQNFLRVLPPSIGLCRKLHTLNVDENDLDALPKDSEWTNCESDLTHNSYLNKHDSLITKLFAKLADEIMI